MTKRFEVIPIDEWESFDSHAPGGGDCSTSHNLFPISEGCNNPQTLLVEVIGDICLPDDDVLNNVQLVYVRLCDDCYKNHTDKKGNHVYDIAFWRDNSSKDHVFREKEVKVSKLISLDTILQEKYA